MMIKARITLWEDQGKILYPYIYPIHFRPYIVIVTATTLNNSEMDNITALLHKFSKKSVDDHTIESANASNVSIAEAMFENRMNIAELVDSDWSTDIAEHLADDDASSLWHIEKDIHKLGVLFSFTR
uniref:Uncharacterized protein n=1 Tax=Solanum lycopersicum TaxID=4081 RepID=K4BZE0_SOLLC